MASVRLATARARSVRQEARRLSPPTTSAAHLDGPRIRPLESRSPFRTDVASCRPSRRPASPKTRVGATRLGKPSFSSCAPHRPRATRRLGDVPTRRGGSRSPVHAPNDGAISATGWPRRRASRVTPRALPPLTDARLPNTPPTASATNEEAPRRSTSAHPIRFGPIPPFSAPLTAACPYRSPITKIPVPGRNLLPSSPAPFSFSPLL